MKKYNTKVNQISFLREDPGKSWKIHILEKTGMQTYKDQEAEKNWLLLQKYLCGIWLGRDSNKLN